MVFRGMTSLPRTWDCSFFVVLEAHARNSATGGSTVRIQIIGSALGVCVCERERLIPKLLEIEKEIVREVALGE